MTCIFVFTRILTTETNSLSRDQLKDVRDKFWDEDVRVGRFCISIGRPERDLRWGTVRPRTTIFDNPDEDREVDALLRLMSG